MATFVTTIKCFNVILNLLIFHHEFNNELFYKAHEQLLVQHAILKFNIWTFGAKQILICIGESVCSFMYL